MNKLSHTLQNRQVRKNRVRARIWGAAYRPRLSLLISNLHIPALLIDDTAHKTLGYVSTICQNSTTGTMTEKAAWVGEEIAKQAKDAKVKTVVFDRGGKLYHGRVAALAEAARKAGLKF